MDDEDDGSVFQALNFEKAMDDEDDRSVFQALNFEKAMDDEDDTSVFQALNFEKAMDDEDERSVYQALNFERVINIEHQSWPRVRLGKPTIRISDRPPHPFLEKRNFRRELNVSKRNQEIAGCSKAPVKYMDNLQNIMNHLSNLNIQRMEEHIKKVELEERQSQISLGKSKEVQMEEFRELFDLGDFLLEEVFDRLEKMTVRELYILFNGDSKFAQDPDLPHDGYKKYLDMRIQRESQTDLHKISLH